MYGNNTELFKLVAEQERVADALRTDAHNIECAASAAEAEQRKCAAAAAEAEQREADSHVAGLTTERGTRESR